MLKKILCALLVSGLLLSSSALAKSKKADKGINFDTLFTPGPVKQQTSVGTRALFLTSGAMSVRGEYRLNKHLSAGFDYWSWGIDAGSSKFSITGMQPFARYYLSGEHDGWYGGAGLEIVTFEYTTTSLYYDYTTRSYRNTSSKGSASATGIALEGGYQWRWKNFYNEANYQLWMMGALESSDGNSVSAGSMAGIGYNIGYYF